ncbi:sigma-70 family RNA polymerase sigma factor [Myroides pelagicus]|uniref:RNA polymerase sigma factor n=1 Tax=Myroides pelagicus TaxID=270914 RepID=UPI002DBDB907|nr:sigma-70 family RNA polymerase sigma factor [Myroides pelagicus]MEC4115238.1 sigma-70 family RNA polymerase sigma factor [Myroides pelagicus]
MSRDIDFKIESIYKQLWNPLYVYALAITKDNDHSEDIIQEVFIDLYKRYDTIELENVDSYLYAAVKYKSFELMRKRSFTTNELELAYHALDQCDLLSEEQHYQYKEHLLNLIKQKAQEVLPDKCYQAFQMRFYAQKSYTEIAQLMNISEHTVKNHISKALHLLRTNLPYCVDLVLILFYLN